jgi:hypothetical protein
MQGILAILTDQAQMGIRSSAVFRAGYRSNSIRLDEEK